jgi:hypothetical protein
MGRVDRVIGITSLLASLALLWTGVRGLEFRSLASTVFSLTEVLGLVLAVVSLGWWGLAAVAVVNVVAVLIWCVVLAARVESKLVYAGIQADESKEAMQALAARLQLRKELKVLGPVERAELIRLLSERARSVPEIEAMAPPIGMLKAIHEVPLDWLVERFDRLLRLSGEPANQAAETADIIHATATNAAATFREIVDAFITVYSGEEPSVAEAA